MQKLPQMILIGKAEIVHGARPRSQTSAGPLCFPWTCSFDMFFQLNISTQLFKFTVTHGKCEPIASDRMPCWSISPPWQTILISRGWKSTREKERSKHVSQDVRRLHLDHPSRSFGSPSNHSWVGNTLWQEMSATSIFLLFADFCLFEGRSPIFPFFTFCSACWLFEEALWRGKILCPFAMSCLL